MDVLAVLEEHGLPEQDISIGIDDDIALLPDDFPLVDLLDEPGDEVHVEGVLEPDDEAKPIEAKLVEETLYIGISGGKRLLIPGDGLLGVSILELGLPLLER